MSRKPRLLPIPNQEALYKSIIKSNGSTDPNTFEVSTEFVPKTEFTQPVQQDVGPSVDLRERNAHLTDVIKKLGLVSRTNGLQKYNQTESGHDELKARYTDPDAEVSVFEGHKNWRMKEARKSYRRAFGGDEKEADYSFASEFLPRFADSKGKENRAKMLKKLAKQRRVFTRKTA